MQKIKIIECPRDAMQGLKRFIPTEDKIMYVNSLLGVGFDTIDVGSFVSPRAVPQMADTAELLNRIDLSNSKSKLLTIVANLKGAQRAVEFEEIFFLGYPFSISETFQMRNTNATIEESLSRLHDINDLCIAKNKKLVVYISMGFGNPYGDPWSSSLVTDWSLRLREELKVEILSLSDTVGSASVETIKSVFDEIMPNVNGFEIGAHLHATPNEWQLKVNAALESGCHRIDGAIRGLGGCPFATDTLTGNLPTEEMVAWLDSRGFETGLNIEKLAESVLIAKQIFSNL